MFLKTFDDLKVAVRSWVTLTEQLYKGIRKIERGQIKVNDYLTVYRFFQERSLVTEGILESDMDTSQ